MTERRWDEERGWEERKGYRKRRGKRGRGSGMVVAHKASSGEKEVFGLEHEGRRAGTIGMEMGTDALDHDDARLTSPGALPEDHIMMGHGLTYPYSQEWGPGFGGLDPPSHQGMMTGGMTIAEDGEIPEEEPKILEHGYSDGLGGGRGNGLYGGFDGKEGGRGGGGGEEGGSGLSSREKLERMVMG